VIDLTEEMPKPVVVLVPENSYITLSVLLEHYRKELAEAMTAAKQGAPKEKPNLIRFCAYLASKNLYTVMAPETFNPFNLITTRLQQEGETAVTFMSGRILTMKQIAKEIATATPIGLYFHELEIRTMQITLQTVMESLDG
jgi:hypothetical protein